MPYVPTFDRTQMMMCSWDSFVDEESIARLIDAFINSLDLTKYDVKKLHQKGDLHMIRVECINCTFMVTERAFVPHANLLKVVRLILK